MKRLKYFIEDTRHFYRLGYTGLETWKAVLCGWQNHRGLKEYRRRKETDPKFWAKGGRE